MFKRTKGYLLLTMLVLTGLAGRLHSNILSGRERRSLVNELRTSKNAVTESLQGLSKQQIKFRPSKNAMCIKECVYHLASFETALWTKGRTALKSPAVGLQKREMTDEELMQTLKNGFGCPEKLIAFRMIRFKSMNEALDLYKDERASLLKYAKTTTDAVREHTIQTPLGIVDAYQFMKLACICSDYYRLQIEEIKANPKFPK